MRSLPTVFAGLMIFAPAVAGAVDETSRVWDNPAREFVLTPSQEAEYKRLALSGSDEKAEELFRFYSMTENRIDAEFWLRLAAERGNCHAIKQYIKYASSTGTIDSAPRMQRWRDLESASCKPPPGWEK